MDFTNRILERRGFGGQRVNMYWLSSAEAEKLVKSVEDALEKVSRLGPNPINMKGVKEVKKEILTTPIE